MKLGVESDKLSGYFYKIEDLFGDLLSGVCNVKC